ncbi:dTDP-4-dehydrorhamnose reductase [Vibrio gazogenes]|uniref:dTDP-4-dehydrorhamnose reductase n=3 Tax=Vibrio gazogenes TaxID=687 RepID=A0A1M5GM36_VIBGA|nr:dTDP-4-dehydrorhamnose reductase [Vibrio gazogenes]USP13872.1 dTDP-4-dehydrorhamnose reductase [Vibrio gazogenes]SHG04753.1 dTDP-4-dehydrorhamnose reductase [Vibrio gazogenes DSM 21264] [Vibrio gazogenes DSM 21264 = NBRC 103151]
MRVLVTGCNGQVGHYLVEQLRGKVDLLSYSKEQLDITDQVAVFSIVSEFAPHYIINAAAYTAVDKAEQDVDLSYAINRDGPQYLAEAADRCGAVMLHISTDYVFDGDVDGSYTERDATAPQSIYGESKLAGEIAVAEACRRHLILRTAWVFGEHGSNFVKTMLRLGAERDALSIVSDQVGGPTYAGDIAKALITMIEFIDAGKEPLWGIYHFSGAPYVSWYEFSRVIFDQAESSQILDKKPLLKAIPTREFPTPAKRPANSRLNCDKIVQQFGIKPSDWQKALINIRNYK